MYQSLPTLIVLLVDFMKIQDIWTWSFCIVFVSKANVPRSISNLEQFDAHEFGAWVGVSVTHGTAADGEGEEAEEPFILLSPCSISNHQAGLGEMWMKKMLADDETI